MSGPVDHRRVQRALFRMQLDPAFAAAIRAGGAAAAASTGLNEADLTLLREADPAGIAADLGGRRRGQVLGNIAGEFTLTLRAARALGAAVSADGFASSDEFHAAIAADRRLPLAFAAWLRTAVAGRSEPLPSFAALEWALARARRAVAGPPPPPGAWRLSHAAAVVDLAAGALDAADRLVAAPDDRLSPLLFARASAGNRESALVVAAERTSAHRLPEARVERLDAPVAALLRRLESPTDAEGLAAFAAAHGADASELVAFVESLVADGVVVTTPASPR